MAEHAAHAARSNDAQSDSEQKNGGRGKGGPKTWIVAIVVVAVVIVVLVVAGGLSSEEAQTASEATQTVTTGWLSIEVPEGWAVESEDSESDDSYDSYTITPDNFEGAILINSSSEIEDYDYETVSESLEGIVDLYFSKCSVYTFETFEEDGAVVQRFHYADDEGVDGATSLEYSGYIQFVYSGDECMMLWCYCADEEYEEPTEELEAILDSMTLENPSAPE